MGGVLVLALPIFPGRLQPSIVGRSELNFRVRDGNGWTLALISTNYWNRIAATNNIICNCRPFVKHFWASIGNAKHLPWPNEKFSC